MTTTTSMTANPALSKSTLRRAAGRTKKRLTSRGATIAALIIAVTGSSSAFSGWTTVWGSTS